MGSIALFQWWDAGCIPVNCCSRHFFVQPIKLVKKRRFACATQTAQSSSIHIIDQATCKRAAWSARRVSTVKSHCRLASATGRRAPQTAGQGAYMFERGAVRILTSLGSYLISGFLFLNVGVDLQMWACPARYRACAAPRDVVHAQRHAMSCMRRALGTGTRVRASPRN